jgi:hypothetical protein
MEELLSTESLDREILEDARKKAARILKTADETVASAAAGWEKKASDAITELRRKYADRLERNKNEILARMPLDKRRSRLEWIEGFLKEAMNACLSGLPRETILALLEKELKRRLEDFPEFAVPGSGPERILNVTFRGLSAGELESLLKKYFPRGNLKTKEADALFSLPGVFPALVIDAPDARLTVSVDIAAADLLRDKRDELVTALLGAGASAPDGTVVNGGGHD